MEDYYEIDEDRLQKDLSYRMKHLKEFTGFTNEDEEWIRNTIGKLAKYAEPVVDSIYDHLFQFSSTSKYFINEDGVLNDAFLRKRKSTLVNWLVKVGEGKADFDFAKYMVNVGIIHRADEGEIPIKVPRHYIITLMSVVQSGITDLLSKELEDKDDFKKAVIAWNKILMLSIEMMLFATEDNFKIGRDTQAIA